jgi:hypothetical protein
LRLLAPWRLRYSHCKWRGTRKRRQCAAIASLSRRTAAHRSPISIQQCSLLVIRACYKPGTGTITDRSKLDTAHDGPWSIGHGQDRLRHWPFFDVVIGKKDIGV